MARSISGSGRSMKVGGPIKRRYRVLLWLALLGGLLAAFLYREPVAKSAEVGVSYGARLACSCRFVGGRDLDSCRADFRPGMAVVWLSENQTQKTVTAYVPLLASQTARYRDGYGCMLEKWSG